LVNYAVGNKSLGMRPLAERTIYNFREKLYLHTMSQDGNEDLIFGQFKEITKGFAEASGLAMGEQRIDTTQFMSNIKKAGRISLAYDVLMRAARKIPEDMMTEDTKLILSPTFKNEIMYKARSSETESKLTILLRMCRDIYEVLVRLGSGHAGDEMRILARLLDEHATAGENGELEAIDGKKVSSKSMQSAYDEDASYRRIGRTGNKGYVASITETCSGENPFQLITDYAVEPNVTSDAEILEDRLGSIAETGCDTLTGDGSFCSAKIINDASSKGIKMQYTNMTGKADETGRLTIDDFETSDAEKWVCPAGHTSLQVKQGKSLVHAMFDSNLCGTCPYHDNCPSRPQKKNFVVRISQNQLTMSRTRKEYRENFQKNVSKRAAIEGTNSALKRKGMGKLRVRGKIKCRLVCGFKILAQNVSRFVKYIQGHYTPKPLLSPA